MNKKKALYYVAIALAFILLLLGGVFICAGLRVSGAFPMIIIFTLSFGGAKLTAALLREKFLKR